MKITLLTPVLATVLGLALAGAPVTVKAQTTPAAAPAPAPAAAAPSTAPKTHKKSDKTEYDGTITAIDATSVTVTNTKKTLTLGIAATTTFKKDKKKATIADFAIGDKVTGSYTTDATGAMTAASLHKKTTKTAKAAAPATAAPAPAPAPAAQ